MQFGFCMHSQFHNTLKYWERSEIKTLFLWHIWILAFSLCVYNESCWYHLGTMELQLTKVPKGFEWDEIRTALRLIIKDKYLYSVFQKTHKTGTCNRTEHQQNALHYLHIQFRQANFIRTQFVTKVNYYSSQNTLKVFLCVCVLWWWWSLYSRLSTMSRYNDCWCWIAAAVCHLCVSFLTKKHLLTLLTST